MVGSGEGQNLTSPKFAFCFWLSITTLKNAIFFLSHKKNLFYVWISLVLVNLNIYWNAMGYIVTIFATFVIIVLYLSVISMSERQNRDLRDTRKFQPQCVAMCCQRLATVWMMQRTKRGQPARKNIEIQTQLIAGGSASDGLLGSTGKRRTQHSWLTILFVSFLFSLLVNFNIPSIFSITSFKP